MRGSPYFRIFNTYAPPNVLGVRSKRQLRIQEIPHSFGTFRQYLIRMPIRYHHDANDSDDVFVRNGILKKIAHRVDEDHFGL